MYSKLAQFDPPLPSSYFGNCIIWYIASTNHVDLVGNEGFTIAAESIGEIIYKRNKDKEYVLNGEWLKEVGGASNKGRYLAITGSPNKPKDSDGDLEIDLYLPKTRMNAFAAIFTDGLSVL
ncbi:hypothetical protein MTR67_042476 [Solanum verrucosum]|uniref:Uncharacterized protein n=1 Tax=Solanum verrucosum TaxID=315347 RepID=A0AAF0UQ20_SOLVR|nr:hypothetical protein MTR67_042476 [Solanum verrucosum]